MILISGATGRTGRHLVDALIAGGIPARAIVRDPGKAADLRRRGLDVITGDLRDGEVLARAMHGIEHALLATANGPEQWDIEKRFIETAAAAGVAHVVKLSAP